jgi:predicted Zn-dependent protease
VAALLYASAVFAHPGDHRSIEELDRLLIDSPIEPSLLIARAALHTRTGQWDQAERDLLLAMDASNETTVAFELANLYYHAGAFKKSLVYIDHYINANPQYAPAFLLRARTAQAYQHNDTAISSYRTYLTIAQNPQPGDYLAAAELLASTGTEGIVSAIEVLDAGINKLGLNPQLQRYAMQLELKRSQNENAISRWRSLEYQLGETPGFQITLARLLFLSNRFNEATQVAAQAKARLSSLRRSPARDSLARKLSALEKLLEQAKT